MAKVYLTIGLLGFVRVFGYFTDPRLSEAEVHRLVGEPARLQDGTRTPVDGLKVITWNIERGEAYDSIVTVLRDLDADVLLLQEVDRDCRRTNYRNVARDLAHALEMNWTSAGEFQEIGEARGGNAAITGQAILSRFPIENAAVLRFAAQDRLRWSLNPVQPRRGGRIALKATTGGMLVYNTHIESGGNDSLGRRQIAEILADHRSDPHAHSSVVIGGDFNNGPVRRAPMFATLLAAEFTDALGEHAERGPTSYGQRHPIDWIFVKNATAVGGRVIHALSASDHFPVIAALHTNAPVAMR
jgi:endonuclease/exonuclease/phosphatase family metal-dependent hydrolase